MKILNKKIDFDFFDADDMEKLESQIEITQSKIHDIKEEKASNEIREICKEIRACFDNIFGEGTSSKIFQNKYSIKLCLEAFHELIEEKLKQEDELNEQLNDFNKYLPKRIEREN